MSGLPVSKEKIPRYDLLHAMHAFELSLTHTALDRAEFAPPFRSRDAYFTRY